MKLQRAQEKEGRNSGAVMVQQAGATMPISKPVRHMQPSFDDLRERIATRAYELYAQRGFREGCAEEDWLDAEREIIGREFSISSDSAGRGAL
jgi:hypothetical protein